MLFGVAGTWKGKKTYPDKTEIKSEEKCTQEKTWADFFAETLHFYAVQGSLLGSSLALVLFPDPGDIPATATAVATVAPTSTCCPPGRRCTSSPRWSSCLMWTSSCRDTTLDTQMTSNGEKHTRTHTHSQMHTCAITLRALLPHADQLQSHMPPPHISFCFLVVATVQQGRAQEGRRHIVVCV